jgi:DNA-binding winged helix-turn-helix (wHTH) protein
MLLGFGEFTLDLDRRCLFAGGREVRLTPKGFALLRLLIERRPKVLGKDEIYRRLWPDTFVTESNVATIVADLREALGDEARRPRFIRTAYKYGYAFAAEVVVATSSEAGGRRPSPWRLIVEHREVALAEGENILGREGPDTVVIASPTVSRRHARLSIDGARAVCEDLGSKNGTWVGSTRATGPTAVADGAELRLGSVVVVARFGASTASTRPIDLT